MDRVAVEQDKNHPTITMVSYKQAEQKFMDKVGKMSDKDKYGHNSLCLFFQRSRTTILGICIFKFKSFFEKYIIPHFMIY